MFQVEVSSAREKNVTINRETIKKKFQSETQTITSKGKNILQFPEFPGARSAKLQQICHHSNLLLTLKRLEVGAQHTNEAQTMRQEIWLIFYLHF